MIHRITGRIRFLLGTAQKHGIRTLHGPFQGGTLAGSQDSAIYSEGDLELVGKESARDLRER